MFIFDIYNSNKITASFLFHFIEIHWKNKKIRFYKTSIIMNRKKLWKITLLLEALTSSFIRLLVSLLRSFVNDKTDWNSSLLSTSALFVKVSKRWTENHQIYVIILGPRIEKNIFLFLQIFWINQCYFYQIKLNRRMKLITPYIWNKPYWLSCWMLLVIFAIKSE